MRRVPAPWVLSRNRDVARTTRAHRAPIVIGMRDDEGGRLGGRLQAARLRAFVGRKEEQAIFDEALCDGGVLFVHGPGGVGKSALLRCFAQRAVAAGRTVVALDGRAHDPSTFLAETRSVLADDRAVVLIDDVGGLETWLRDRFLPALPVGALVVIAGRLPPDLTWRADPGWADTVRVVRLGELETMDADALLDARGVAGELRDPLLAFAGGHPLALSLGAATTGRGPRWAPAQDVVAALLDRIVGTVPSPDHRRALDVCAHTFRCTEDVLRAALPGSDTASLFAWLRRLPFVESGPFGLHPHDVVRGALAADLRWRDPQGCADLRGRLTDHLTQRIHLADDADVLGAVGSLFHLHRDTSRTAARGWRDVDEVYEDVFRPEDAEDLARLAAERGATSAVSHWVLRQPEAFRLYRCTATGELLGACAWLRLESATHEDPVAAAAWACARSTAPLRQGEHLAVHRSWVRGGDWGTSPVLSLIHWRAVGWALRSERLAWSCTAVRRDTPSGTGERVREGDVEYLLSPHDWRSVPPRVWLDRLLSGGAREAVPVRHEPALAVLSQEEFTEAVRKALRHLSKHGELAANVLTRSRLLAGRTDPAHALRALLEDAIRDLGRDPRAGKPHRALDVTYLRGAPTQEAAAERLGLSFSTYRRHLIAGVERVSEALWRRELHGSR
jgi:hypothetical protein